MGINYDIRSYSGLRQRLPEFAITAGELARMLGLEKSGGRGPKGEPASERVIRDYVRRRVLSPTLGGPDNDERGYYGFRHLVEFLAARVLINDGWPLDKIAERNLGAATDELLALIPGQPEENDALALARSFRRPDIERFGIEEDSPDDLQPSFLRRLDKPALGPSERASVSARRRAELPLLMRNLFGHGAAPTARRCIALEFDRRATLIVDEDWLRRIGPSDAEAFGRAVVAALIDYRSLAQGKDLK